MNIKSLFGAVDMTEGSPIKKIIQFSIPMIIGNFFQQMYNAADAVIVGEFVGDNALAAVGSAGPVFNLMLALFIGIATGAGIMVSQYFGARKRDDLSRSIGSIITMTGMASLAIMIIGSLLAKPLLILLKTPPEIFTWCQGYLTIIFVGFAGMAYYNILGGILRGLGDAVSALVYLIIATILNIVLDLFFVGVVGIGVYGAAIATIIAQFISAYLTYRKLKKMDDVFDLKREYMKPEKVYSRKMITLGLPSGITQAIFSLSLLAVQRLTNSFGPMYVAANVIVMRVDGFVMMPAMSFGVAMTTFAGQNIGAGKMDRVQQGAKSGTVFAMSVSAVISLLIVLFGKNLMAIFTKTQDLIDISYHVMLILVAGYIVFEITQCLCGTMRGAGDTVAPMWISIGASVLFRVPAAYLMVHLSKTPQLPQGNFFMLSTSLLCTWILGATLSLIVYRSGRWKNKALVKAGE